MKINNNHADELILSEFTHFRTAHFYKQKKKQKTNKQTNKQKKQTKKQQKIRNEITKLPTASENIRDTEQPLLEKRLRIPF
jgi:hypothetical protein